MTGEGFRVASSPDSAIEAGMATRRADAVKYFIFTISWLIDVVDSQNNMNISGRRVVSSGRKNESVCLKEIFGLIISKKF